MPREWSSGFCDCCAAGCLTCILAFWCYPLLIGLNAHKMNETFLMCCCPVEGHLQIRSKIRSEHGIEGSLLKDCLLISFCHPCATIQEANEIAKVYGSQPK
ncbi:Placenta-specific gene 8 protein-like [Oopsacas minuta]|uniref:Placenta-specific gene 8 protein-like n=1 Tax=Oopsacas minuta TaxID=111878 RepID=A0AAV7KAL6_9METZ|nr:Placenta-specific gene 8 protein-like [Oopsacas minuta]